MEIKTITTDDLRRMEEKEGLIIMGCGGDLQEWVDGMNEVLTKSEHPNQEHQQNPPTAPERER